MRTAIASLFALLLIAPAAHAISMTVDFSGSDGIGGTTSVSFAYDSTLALTPDGPNSWSAGYQGPVVVDGSPVANAFILVGIDSGISGCDSGAALCDYFFLDIYLDADDAAGPSGPTDVNNAPLWIVDFELPTGTVTPGALPDFEILAGAIDFFVIEFADTGLATVDTGEWLAPAFNAGATGSITFTPIPEPGTAVLTMLGLVGLGLRRR